jgi:hypothetical protein
MPKALQNSTMDREETLKKLFLKYSIRIEEHSSDLFFFDMDTMESWVNYFPQNNCDTANIKMNEGKPKKKKITFTSLFKKKKAPVFMKTNSIKGFLK